MNASLVDIKKSLKLIERKLIEHDAKFNLLQWMVGATFASSMASLWLLMRMLSSN